MAVPDIVTHYHTQTVSRSILRGLLMEHGNMKFWGLFLSVFLFFSTDKVTLVDAETETVGQITFECQDGWSIYKGNCFRAFNIPLNFLDASLTCYGQGAFLYYPENEIEYFEYVATLLPETIWFDYRNMDGEWKLMGEMVPPEFMPGWGNYQPDLDKEYTAVNPKEMLMLTDGDKLFPFVCKRRACKQGYVPCDLGLKCIPKNQVCNGLPECADRTDENNCPNYGTSYQRLTTADGFFTTQTFSDFEMKTWNLEAPIIKRIKLTVPTMNLEKNIMFCEVWSGGPTPESSEMLARFTGYTPSVTIYSKYNFLMVRMYAKDLSSAVSSYTFRWTTNIPEIPDSRVHQVVAKDSFSFFSIPFTSEPYGPIDLQLWWQITAPEGKYISYYLDVTPKTGYTEGDMEYKVMAEGRTLEYRGYYISATNEVYVQSDFTPKEGAVEIKYKLGCEMEIDTAFGFIISPEPIPNDFECMWTLRAGEEVSRGMSLRFLELDLMEDPRLDPATESIDKFMIYPNQSDTSLTDLSELGHSPGGRFRVHFMSDAAFMSGGFKIRFGRDCEPLVVSSETIKSTDMAYMFENVTLSCPTGYKFHMEKYRDYDSVTLQCHADGWKIEGENPGAIPECRIVWCGPPTKIENGGVTGATGLQYKDNATYFCLGGFDMSGIENATCNEDGDWIDVPSCTSTGCTAPSESYLLNGEFTVIRGNAWSGSTAEFNTVIEFSCNEGYEILGAVKSHCDTGQWTHESNPPTCQKIVCAVPQVPNSDVPLAGPSVKVSYEGTYTINCNNNYLFSNGETQIQITCQSNGTFDITPVCEDINECTDGSNSCDSGSTTCMNTDGEYICNCISGYERIDDYTCTDIQECSDENGGCSTTCIEENGSYHCECDDGFELFEGDGFNGFRLPEGETGLRRGDRYFIDHTCVPVQCPDLQPVSNGKYLTNSLTDFHYMDKVTLQCHDGYKVNKTGALATSFESTCGSDGNWNELVGCEARQCTLPSTPTYGSYDKTEVFFGQKLTLTCNITEERKKTLTAVCLYDNDDVRFAGDDITQCPEIDCGDPELVMPVGSNFFGGIKPGTTTYFGSSSSFSFTCNAGFDVKGESENADNPVLVKCKENGRWDLGTLACTGKMCDDPGTPVDAVQVFNGYEINSVLYYTCVRDGFKISGPVNYTCEYNSDSDTSTWSNNLAQNIPECTDAENPTIFGNCDETYYIDAVDEVNYGTVRAVDNFAIKSLTQDRLLNNGDRLTADLTLTFTYTDFENNDDTCMISFKIIDRTSRPTLTCPNSKTISVSSRVTGDYNTSSDIQVSGGELVTIPSAIPVSVSKIGTAEIVTAKATDEFGNEASCTFMVNFEANACFEEDIFADRNANRNCVEEGSTLVCTSTCTGSNLYYDKTNKKNFTCSGQGNWDYTSTSPHERFCLEQENPEFEVDLDLVHRFQFPSTAGCVTAYRSLLEQSTSNFASRIRSKCSQDWLVSVVSERAGGLFELEATVKLTLVTLSATSAEREECIAKIANDPTVFSTSSLNCPVSGLGALTAESVSNGTGSQRCQNVGFYLDGDMCLSYGPGQYFDDLDTNNVANCPIGEYQDGLAQTTCKTCPEGYYPNSDQTECLPTCSNGFISQSGFYSCTPCPVDEYWVTKDSCNSCPDSKSTVGVEGAADVTKCYEPCAAGTYSTTGYADSGCKPCPVNFYQDEEGKMTCKECDANQITSASGSKTINNCTDIEDDCDSAYCSNAGTCQFQYHERRCICNSGYYGDRCEKMYHICDGNPCTSGATCIKGEGPEDFTCTCRTDLDTCEMVVAFETKIGSQNPGPYTTKAVLSLTDCKKLCLNDVKCIEASYLAGTTKFCALYDTTLTESQLDDQINPDDQHLKKVCNIAFGGDRCERDTYDNCLNAGCSENSKCIDKVNGFQCICPSAGGYTGALCQDARNPCSPNPCARGTCKAFGSVRYECTCPDGYKGLTCEQDIDECELHPLACAYDGRCDNLENQYSCTCKPSFFGRNCEDTPDFCRNHNCGGDNVCYNSLNRMEGVCVCDTNLFEPQYRCAMTSVANEKSVDQIGTISSNSVQSFEECEKRCQENPDCSVANFIENSNSFFCILFDDSYTGSSTEDPYTAIYKDCTNQPDEAFACNKIKEPCDNNVCKNGTCQNAANGLSSSCNCDPGFTGSYCQHSVDDCVGNRCENNARCIDEHRDYRCECAPGFEGEMCNIDTDDCPGSCNTTFGTCVDRVDGYECQCNPGYVGNNCDIEINECASYPCQHGGECEDAVNGFECNCTAGWTGDMCEQRIDHCVGESCGNDGECISLAERAFCRCEGGATGKNCEKATLLCETLSNIDVCTNGGVCVSQGGTAECSCPLVHNVTRCYMEDGLSGKNGGNNALSIPPYSSSSLTEDVCKMNCLRNKLCGSVTFSVYANNKFCIYYGVEEEELTDQVVGEDSIHFRRNCPIDYSGVSCELVKNSCATSPCKHNGRCIPEGPKGYYCECEPGYSGAACEVVADPCDSNPCGSQAVCRSTPTDYICQCEGGKVWTGSSCRMTRTDYTLLVNAASYQPVPQLLTTFRIKSDELSVMMRVRVHTVNKEQPFAYLFALFATSDLHWTVNSFNEITLFVTHFGITVQKGSNTPTEISFDENFGNGLFNGDWHYVGISIDKDGMLSATIDALHLEEPVFLGANKFSLDHNAQVTFGYGYIAEYQSVEIYDMFLDKKTFSNALIGVRPQETPIQSFTNILLPPSAKMNTYELSANLAKNPYLDVPVLNCSAAEDVFHVASERLTSISSISQLLDIYGKITASSGENLEYRDSSEDTYMWGYHLVSITGHNESTMNYGECRLNLYIRYNAACPAVISDDTVQTNMCPINTETNSVCEISCTDQTKVLSAPTPNYIVCGHLGVNDFRHPFEDVILPSCMSTQPVKYQLVVAMQFSMDIVCTKVPSGTLSLLGGKIRENFLNDISPSWDNLCEGILCDNLHDVTHQCVDETSNTVSIHFLMDFTSKMLTARNGGDEINLMDAMLTIIQIEGQIDVASVAGAKLIQTSVEIDQKVVCPSGHRLDETGDLPVCVPCSEGMFLKDGMCMPCDFGSYQDEPAQEECKVCEDGKTTYQKHSKTSDDCKETCQSGSYYDEDENKCKLCERHFYQPSEGKNYCIPCGKQFKTVGNGSKSFSDCKEDCPPGEQRSADTGLCVICPRGSWRSLEYDDCQSCPENTTTYKGVRAETEGDCEIDICSLGEYFDVDEKECTPCGEGFYQDELYELECVRCPGNKTTPTTGTADPDNCEFYCALGYERKGTEEVCLICERGLYKDNVGDSKFQPCAQCPTGTTDMKGATSRDNCSLPICGEGQVIDDNNECKDCPLDYFSDVELAFTSTQCMSCGSLAECTSCGELYGTAGLGSTSDQCMRYCPPGEFLNGNDCDLCPRGYYKDNAGSSRFDNCTKCPDRNGQEMTTDSEGTDNVADCNVYKCAAGYIHTSTGCEPCELNTYQAKDHPLSTDKCIPCQPRFGLSTNTRFEGTDDPEKCLVICEAGKYLENNGCKSCPRGTFKENVGDSRFGNCTDCPVGQTTEDVGADSSAKCDIPKCAAGNYLVDKECTACPVDQYSDVVNPNSAVECIACPSVSGVVYGTEFTGTDSEFLCLPTCPGGKEFDSDQCKDCQIGFFKGENERFGDCISCETVYPGYVTSEVGAESAEQCDLRDCPAGEKIVDSDCVKCPNGTYQNEARQTVCIECGENLSTDGEGKTSELDCLVFCAAGLQGTDSCTRCPEGQFKASPGYATCQDCPLDLTSNDARTDCDIVFCSVGKEYTESGDCRPCEVGFYKDEVGNDQKCTLCPTGKTTDGTGQASCDLLHCVPGRYELNSKCELCPVGTYKSIAGNQECTDCPSKLTTGVVTGATSTTQCDTVVCDPGSYRKPNQKTVCTPCEIGRYQPASGMTSCFVCPNSEITLEDGQSSEEACVPECQKGQQYNSTTKQCLLCPTGTYKDSVGNVEMCQPCDEDTTTAGQGSTDKSDCSQNVCPPGKFYQIQDDKVICLPCPVGKYSDKTMLKECIACPNGGTTQADNTDSADDCIEDCGAGAGYQTSSGNCEVCPKGQFNDKQGRNPNTCKHCPPGKTNTQAGSTSCSYPAPVILEQRINLKVWVSFHVAIDECSDTSGINLVLGTIIGLMKTLFQQETDQRYNSELRFCHGQDCSNLVLCSSQPVCQLIQSRKRAITHELKVEACFNDISDSITDTEDDDANIDTVEIVSLILKLFGNRLTDNTLEILFTGLENITRTDICSVGQELVEDMCEPCQAGYFGSSAGICTQCEIDTYQDSTGEKECKPCPLNTYTENNFGSTSINDCIPICQAGNEFNSLTKTCSECEIGYYKVAAGNDEACTRCPSDRTTRGTGSTSESDCSQNVCLAGQYYYTDAVTGIIKCNPCDIGTFNPNVMVDTCQTCPDGKSTLLPGAKLSDQCISCGPGTGFSTSSNRCLDCPEGQFNDGNNPNPNSCKFCPAGTTTADPGQTSCDVVRTTQRKLVTISLTMTYKINPASCTETELERIRTVISVRIRISFNNARKDRYGGALSFCSSDCTNINVKFRSGKASEACPRRRKRELTQDLPLIVEFQNVTESTEDSQTNAELPTEEVIKQLLTYNDNQLTPEPGVIEYESSGTPEVQLLCSAGEQPLDNECVQCGTGRYSSNGETCELCGQDTYQDEQGQSSCKDCPARTFFDGSGATASSACQSWCDNNPTYCNNRGVCSDTGRRSGTCSCTENYQGTRCEIKKEPASDLPAILGGAIGGGAALLFIILIAVGFMYRCSRGSSEKKKEPYRDPEYVHNGAYDGTYDNFGYYDGQVRPVAPYPSIGYPAIGYKPDTSFEEGSYARAYRYAPSIDGNERRQAEDTQFMWTA